MLDSFLVFPWYRWFWSITFNSREVAICRVQSYLKRRIEWRSIHWYLVLKLSSSNSIPAERFLITDFWTRRVSKHISNYYICASIKFAPLVHKFSEVSESSWARLELKTIPINVLWLRCFFFILTKTKQSRL